MAAAHIGMEAQACATELQKAKNNFPFLRFTYPTDSQLKIMKRDLRKAALEKLRLDRIFDDLLTHMSPEEIQLEFERRTTGLGKNRRRRRDTKR